jgi:hypothetical protein
MMMMGHEYKRGTIGEIRVGSGESKGFWEVERIEEKERDCQKLFEQKGKEVGGNESIVEGGELVQSMLYTCME